MTIPHPTDPAAAGPPRLPSLGRQEWDLDTLRLAVESFPWPLLIVNGTMRVVVSNRAWRDEIGAGIAQVEGALHASVVQKFCTDPEDAARLVRLVADAFARKASDPVLISVGGPSETRWWHVVANLSEQSPFVTLAYQEVTALVRAQHEQRAQQTLLEHAQQVGRMGHWEFSRELGVAQISPQALAIFGVSEVALVDFAALMDQVPEGEREGVRAAIRAARAGEAGPPIRHRIVRSDGTARWVDHTFGLVPASAGEGTVLMGVIQDVTDQVAALEALRTNREALRESNTRRREALLIARAAPWRLDISTGRMSWSPEALEIFGDTLGETADEVVRSRHPEDSARVARTFQEHGRTGEPFSVRYRTRIGNTAEWRWVENRVVPEVSEEDVLVGYRGILQDIDEQIERETALRESDDRQREALRIARAAVWTWDRRTRSVWQSTDLYELMGYASMPQDFEARVNLRHPDDREPSVALVNDAIRRREPFTVRYRLARPDGSWGWIEERGVPEFDADGEMTGYRGTRQDVDEQVRREEALRESDERIREALVIARAANWTWDYQTKELWQSPELYTMLGYESVPETYDQRVALRHPEDQERSRAEAEQAMRERRPFVVRYRLARPGGGWVWIEQRGTPKYDATGQYLGYRGTRQDVDEQVRREEALRESDERMREALLIARAANWTWDYRTKQVWQSSDIYTLFGYDQMPDTFEDRVALRHPEDQQRSRDEAEQAMRQQQPFVVRYRLARADGSWAWIEQRGAPHYDAAGQYVGYRGTWQDVDEQVQREESLREASERQREALRIARAEIWRYDAKTRALSRSDDLLRLYGYESLPEEPEAMVAMRHPDDLAPSRASMLGAMKARQPFVVRYRFRRADGSWSWVETRGVPQFSTDGEYLGYRGTRQDVDEQVRREEELREALKIARAGFWYWGRHDPAPWWSPELYEMIGLPVADMPALGAAERHPDDDQRVEELTRTAIRAHRAYTVRYRVRHHVTREWIWMELRGVPLFSTDGVAVAYRGVIRDISEEMERQAELERSQALLEQAQRLSRVGSFAIDLESGEQRWSDEQYRILGFRPGEVTPTPDLFYARVHPDDVKDIQAAFRNVIKTGQPATREYRLILPGGEIRTLHGAAEARLAPDGRVVELVGATQDVTERIEAEARVRRSEARLRGVLDSVGDGITLLTSGNRNNWTNAAFLRMVGYTEEEMAEVGPAAVLDADAARDTTGWWQRVSRGSPATDLPRTHRLRLRHKDGSYISAESAPSILRDGDEVIGLLSVVRDTTERDHLQAQVDAATAETRQIIQTAPLPIFVLDADGTIAMANDSTVRAFGWDAEDLVGQPASALGAGLTPMLTITGSGPALEPSLEPAPAGLRTHEVTCRRQDGSEFPAQIAMTELHVEGGRQRYLCVLIDLTERKRAEEELTRMQKAEALGTLVAGVAHDFNNLLAAMVGGITMAQSEPEDPHWLDIAQEAAGRATRLVQQLLQFSRRSKPAMEAVDPVALVERTVDLVKETFDRQITVTVDVQPVEGHLAADEGQLQQVMLNLLVNARDAVLERALADGPAYRPLIRIAVRPDILRDAPAVRIDVSDNGPGMLPSVRARAFDPFFTTKPIGSGTGLGLATVAGIVERHEGEVTLDSAVGAGTTFSVRLGLVDDSHTAPVPDEGEPATCESAPRTALVIDDEEMVRAVITAYLESANYRVHSINDGNEAIRLVESGVHFDVILTDISMPSPSGWDILAALRGRPGVPPIIVASGYAEAEEARIRGAAGFLQKPYSKATLFAAVEDALAQHAPAAE